MCEESLKDVQDAGAMRPPVRVLSQEDLPEGERDHPQMSMVTPAVADEEWRRQDAANNDQATSDVKAKTEAKSAGRRRTK
jgi:hypothetical protein